MPRRFLSRAQRARFSQFPDEVTIDDRVVYFTLTPADLVLANERRGDSNRLGLAMLVCALRYLGYFPTDIRQSPVHVVSFVADQLQVASDTLATYAGRAETRREHLGAVMQHLDFRRVEEPDKEEIVSWLGARALEHDRPSTLLQMACERLYQRRLVRPAITTMEEIVADARQWAQQRTIEVLVDPLPEHQRSQLDTLLISGSERELSPLAWLRRFATGHSDRDILEALDKLAVIRQWDIAAWQVGELPPNRLKHLARVARHVSTQGLRRKQPDEKRYAILMAFLHWAYQKTIDELIQLFDLCLADAHRKSRRDLKEFQLHYITRMSTVLGYFRDVSSIVLNDEVPDQAVRPAIYEQVSADTLQAAVDEVELFFTSGRRPTHLDFLDRRYSYFRRFIPAFLKALTFHNYADQEDLLESLDVLREMNEQEGKLPATLESVPTGFVPAQWQPRVLRGDGSVNRRDYELCVISELQAALRSGAIWVEGSQQYANLDSYLIPRSQWEHLRDTYCELVGIPQNGVIQLELKQSLLEQGFSRLDQQLPDNQLVRIENGKLILTPLEEEEQEFQEEHPLATAVGDLLPTVQLGELLAEVDAWTGFSDHLTHAGGVQSRAADLPSSLYAAIVTQACNLELSRMAFLSDFSYSQLRWATNWYLRDETLQPATDVLIDFQYQQLLSQYWGNGTFSSSDGQRFAVARKTNQAAPLPRYFGYGRGLNVLTWTSNQHSQYGVRVTPPNVREATYTLDAILDNDTSLDIKEHTTDTTGYTDIMFALFDLLGMQFSPRLRDIGDYKLYGIDPSLHYQHIQPLISSSPLNTSLFVDDWDEMLRVAASMKMGWVTSSVFISKLLAFPRQHKITQILLEYGRLIRSIFIPNYLDDDTYRRRILVQLNKGEGVHGLREFLFFDNKGQIRKQQPDDLVNLAGCLNLVSNAIVVWNTVYMQAALDELVRRGYPVREADLVHLSPTRFRHINRYGRFRFELGDVLAPSGLRPFRVD